MHLAREQARASNRRTDDIVPSAYLLGVGANEDKNGGEGSPRRYASPHGDAGRVLHESQGQSSSSAEDARPSGIPSLEELKELNRRIHNDAGTPERYKLDQPSPLRSCLDQARIAYSPSPDGVIWTAAVLAHGIAQAQSFRDGNRRTAYFATQSFLSGNGYGYLSSEGTSDHTLARYLNQVVEHQAKGEPTLGPEQFAALFSRRLHGRRPPGSPAT